MKTLHMLTSGKMKENWTPWVKFQEKHYTCWTTCSVKNNTSANYPPSVKMSTFQLTASSIHQPTTPLLSKFQLTTSIHQPTTPILSKCQYFSWLHQYISHLPPFCQNFSWLHHQYISQLPPFCQNVNISVDYINTSAHYPFCQNVNVSVNCQPITPSLLSISQLTTSTPLPPRPSNF